MIPFDHSCLRKLPRCNFCCINYLPIRYAVLIETIQCCFFLKWNTKQSFWLKSTKCVVFRNFAHVYTNLTIKLSKLGSVSPERKFVAKFLWMASNRSPTYCRERKLKTFLSTSQSVFRSFEVESTGIKNPCYYRIVNSRTIS